MGHNLRKMYRGVKLTNCASLKGRPGASHQEQGQSMKLAGLQDAPPRKWGPAVANESLGARLITGSSRHQFGLAAASRTGRLRQAHATNSL